MPPLWTWERWQWRGTPHSPKLQHYWSLIIRLFSAISRTLVRGVLPLCRDAVGVFCSPSWLAKECLARRDQVPFFGSLVWLDLGLNPVSQANGEHSNHYAKTSSLQIFLAQGTFWKQQKYLLKAHFGSNKNIFVENKISKLGSNSRLFAFIHNPTCNTSDTQLHKVQIKGKWSNPGKGVIPFPTPWCSNPWLWLVNYN